ncbi:signal recognition particle 14 kDa protein-like protein [Sarcoptes scabiei]|uniref:Signal recognition particle 14 kDa protein n=1 Tax=Sarcoptes scabiei TaxID=52283 RepID=A0A132A4A8_SARSC|nr:signal recognition particle 14 kDa protein-like protein [Sarcoptes scabiei]
MLLTKSETFLSEMSKLFYSNQTNGGSLYITMKRIDNSKKPTPNPRRKQSKKVSKNNKSYPTKSIDQPSESSTSSNVPKEYYCLIRVHDNKRKISTIVSSKDVNKFQQVTYMV